MIRSVGTVGKRHCLHQRFTKVYIEVLSTATFIMSIGAYECDSKKEKSALLLLLLRSRSSKFDMSEGSVPRNVKINQENKYILLCKRGFCDVLEAIPQTFSCGQAPRPTFSNTITMAKLFWHTRFDPLTQISDICKIFQL